MSCNVLAAWIWEGGTEDRVRGGYKEELLWDHDS